MGDIFCIGSTEVGKGLFAARDIKKGETILEFKGQPVNGSQAEEIDIKEYGRIMGNALQIGQDKYLYLEDPGRMINHSCNPNAGIKNDTTLIGILDIKKGEEIRFDYSCTMDEDYWIMDCACSEKNCRKKIRDFKCLPEDVKTKYLELGVVQTFIAEKYNTGNPNDK